MRPLLPLLLCAGCAANLLEDEEGRQRLRTALYAIEPGPQGATATVVLSNGAFGCTLQDSPNPDTETEALVDLGMAACREDARHVLLEFARPTGTAWSAVYDGVDWPTPTEHSVRGSYYAVLEAELAREDGLIREPRVTEDREEVLGVGGTGELDEPEDGVLRGDYAHPELGLELRFAAEECRPQDWVFARIAALGRLRCEEAE